MVFIFIVPSGSGQYSDIAYVDATMTSSASESRAVDINSNGTYLASGYDGFVAVHDVDSLELIKSFTIESDVLDVQFSPDGLWLAFSRSGSSSEANTIQIIDVLTLQLTSKHYGSNSQPDMIQWSPDGDLLALPNSNNGIDLLRVADMEVERTLNGEHNTRVTCISFSSLGSYILTGDESGRLVMWSSQGNPTDKEWSLDSEIKACSFDSADEQFAVLTVEGQLTTWSFAGGSLEEVKFEGGSALHWSADGSAIHVLETGASPRLITVDSTNLEESVSVYLAHQALDFTHKENEFGTREMAFIATNTGHIAVYGAMPLPEGYGETGADLDGDKIPDSLDDDDDGDGIVDQRDNYCQEVAQSCSKSPNIETIRGINIFVNSTTFVIEDTFTLDIQTSSIFRNLSRRSLVADIQLSQDETNLFAQTICRNMNENHYVSSWENIILLSSGQLTDGKVECQIESGMTLTAQSDYNTHIAVTYILTFNVSKMTYPFEFTLQSQPSATDTSLAQHAQMHPIDVTAKATDSQTFYWSPWWTSQSELQVSLEEQVESKPGLIAKVVQVFISYPILFLPILGLVAGGVVLLIRTKNSIGMNLDFGEEGDDEHHEEDENNEHHEENGQEKESDISDSKQDAESKSETTAKSPRKAIGREPKDTQNEVSTPARRTAKANQYEIDGPITKVKRKRLDSGLSEPLSGGARKTTSKRKTVTKTQPKDTVKTRRVVTYSEDKDENE
jgi:WD40 repeat protein